MLNVNQNSDKNLYDLNSHGYRCQEFADIDWQSSFVVMGCSRIFGESLLDDQETIPGVLSKITQVNAINLGVCGSGIDFILFNTMKMIESNSLPKAVFILWPDPERFCKFQNNRIIFHGSWSDPKDLDWVQDNNSLERNYQYSDIVKYLWSSKSVPVIGLTHHPINQQITENVYTEWLDHATDGIHWGPKTCEFFAKKFHDIYKGS